MVEKRIIGGICHAIHQYVKGYDKNKKLPFLNTKM